MFVLAAVVVAVAALVAVAELNDKNIAQINKIQRQLCIKPLTEKYIIFSNIILVLGFSLKFISHFKIISLK